MLAASLLVLALVAATAALRAEFNAGGRGEADGTWVAAGAVALGPLRLSGVAARGVPLRLELHWGRWRWPLPRRAPRPKPEPTEPEPKPAAKSGTSRWGSALGLGPLELAELALREGRYLSWERLLLDITYGFNDVALTGRVAGALYALSGALPAKFVIRQRPIWAASERWEASVDGCLRLWPGLVLFSVLWYMLRRRLAGTGTPRRAPSGLSESAHNPS